MERIHRLLFIENQERRESIGHMKCLIYGLVVVLLVSPFGCSSKPAYLQQSKKTEISDRWQVAKIDPARLSPDEAQAYQAAGVPQFIRLHRKHSLDREPVYTWVYTDPIRLFFFIDGKKVDYVVVDDNPSSWNEHQKEMLFWTGITTGAIVALGLLYYFLVAED